MIDGGEVSDVLTGARAEEVARILTPDKVSDPAEDYAETAPAVRELIDKRLREAYGVEKPGTEPRVEDEVCAVCGYTFTEHTPPGVLGQCPPRNKSVDKQSTPGVLSETPPASPFREALVQAARKSWQWEALEQMEALRRELITDAPGAVFEHFGALAQAIAQASTSVSPDVLPIPDTQPPFTWKQGAREFPNTWEGRPAWQTHAIRAAGKVMDAIDVDAPMEVYNAFGQLKEAITGAKPPQ